MFNRKYWKYHTEDTTCLDLDTAPHNKNIRRAGQAIHALSLGCLVEEIMESDDGAVITYHTDGSRTQGVGSYTVQGITINGRYRSLPALPISSESRANLDLLKKTVLSILSAVSGVPMKDIFKKISYQMTDAAAHNFQVDNIIASDFEVDHVPKHLLSQTHPCLMFIKKVLKVFSDIEVSIGPDKIYSNFLVNATTSHETVFKQYIDCLTRLVSPDFDHKSWNYSKEFSLFISPKKNWASCLKMERFNRFVYLCAVIVYIEEDVQMFLNSYDHINNTLACIVRSFGSIEYLTVFCAVGALIGIHLIEPYLSVTYYDQMKYSELIPAMQLLYEQLIACDPHNMLNISSPSLKFISQERFSNCCRWPEEVLQKLMLFINANQTRIVEILRLILPQIAQGFFQQRGNIFGFGDFEKNSSELLPKQDFAKLNEAPINNLDSERSVGSINYELKIRGAKQIFLGGFLM